MVTHPYRRPINRGLGSAYNRAGRTLKVARDVLQGALLGARPVISDTVAAVNVTMSIRSQKLGWQIVLQGLSFSFSKRNRNPELFEILLKRFPAEIDLA